MFQIYTKDSRLCYAQITGYAGGYVYFLGRLILSLKDDHTQYCGTLSNIGKSDHRPQHGSAVISDKL